MFSAKKLFSSRNIPYIALLIALEIILQVIGNNVMIGPVNLNLSLVPIAVGSILFGPLCGLLLGFINSLFALLSSSTLLFYEISTIGTLLTCLLKSMLAGFLSGVIFYPFRKKNISLGCILSSLTVPIVNTFVFIIFSLLFFTKGTGYEGNALIGIITVYVGFNFFIEFVGTLIFAAPITIIVKYTRRKKSNEIYE